MFNKQTITIDSQEKVGTLPDVMTSNWTSRNPLRDGAISVGKYTVPDNTTSCVKFLWPFGQFANIPRVPSLTSMPVGIVKLQVNGVDKMEFRIGGIKATFGGSLGTSDFDISRRQLLLFDGVQFAEGDIVRLIVTQDKLTTTGTPQVCYNVSFIGVNTSTGATIIEKQRSIITVETANQIIASYTILSGGFTLQDLTLQTQVGDFMMGHMQILINGMVVMEFPVSDSMGCTRPSGGMFGMIPFYDGLNFGAGSTIEARIDPSVSVNQKFHMFTVGEESATGGTPTESKLKRWSGTEWVSVGTIVVFQ
jgi:hypothetical protein